MLNKLVDNNLTREEILAKCKIAHTEASDAWKMCQIVSDSFHLPGGPEEAAIQFEVTKVNFDKSVKFYDEETKDIYGLLTICDYDIKMGSPIILKEPIAASFLSNFRPANGHSFVLDERIRNSGVDKQMLWYSLPDLKNDYDYIWCGVEADLKSHNYWQRLGFLQIFSIDEASFYVLPINKKMFDDNIY